MDRVTVSKVLAERALMRVMVERLEKVEMCPLCGGNGAHANDCLLPAAKEILAESLFPK